MEGQLVAHPEWGVAVRDAASGDVVRVVWPHGYKGRVSDDRLSLVDAGSRSVAGVGDLVRIDDGELPGNSWRACGAVTLLEDQ
jgi:hypothetical protein